MRPLLFRVFPAVLSVTMFSVGCSGSAPPPVRPTQETPKTGPVDVQVASFPAQFLAQRVGGDAVTVNNVLPAGEDPPFWNPTGDVVATVQKGELIIANGAGFEKWMQTATLPEEALIDTSQGVELIHIQGETHSHGKGGEHSHAGIDPHTWSDPMIYLQQAQAVHRALIAARPDQKSTFDANLATFQSELEALDRALKDATAPGRGIPLAANHPAYNYLARRYGLDIHAFDFDPEDDFTPDNRTEFEAWADGKTRPLRLLWESEPSEKVRRAIPAGTLHVYVDPLEQPPDRGTYDYIAQAQKNVATFQTIFAKATSAPSSDASKGTP